MSKAERRKRARQRAKEREKVEAERSVGSVTGLETTERAAEREAVEASSAAAAQAEPAESPFITGPIAPRPAAAASSRSGGAPARGSSGAPAQRAARLELPSSAQEPVDEDDEAPADDEDEDAAQNGQADDEDDDDREDDDDEDDEGDELDDDIDEAIFNLACASLEQGPKLGWEEVVGWLCSVEVPDPRLALVCSLLADRDEKTGQPVPVSGERVLATMAELDLGDLVDEAREAVSAAPLEDGDDEDERALVRTSARELAAESRAALERGEKRGDSRPNRALKASALKPKTALGAALPVGRVR